MPRRYPSCPKCGSERTVPIVYGLPGPELQEAARRGEVLLGGCIVRPGQPTMACLHCKHGWRPETYEQREST